MHNIETYYNWRDYYKVEEDDHSPFFGKEYNVSEYTNTIYNHYIHPLWDGFGSSTVYLKIIYANYESKFAIIELIGEWNDAINNDIMFLKREIADFLINKKINKFILIGENILNFHASDDCYYEEWSQDVEDGWIAFINFRDHVIEELKNNFITNYILILDEFNDLNWRKYTPNALFEMINVTINRTRLPSSTIAKLPQT